MSEAKSEFWRYRGADIHLARAGAGPPALILHSELADRSWTQLHRALAQRFELIAPDLPGFARSKPVDWLEGIDDLVFFALDLMTGLGFKRYSVLGESLGGWLAAEIAVYAPSSVEYLILAGALGLEIPGLSYADTFMMTPDRLLRSRYFTPPVPADLSHADVDGIVEDYENRAAFARLAWSTCFADPKLADRLGRVTSPTLVLWGDSDKIAPLGLGEVYSERIPDAKFNVMTSCGHLPFTECPGVASDIIVDFVGGAADGPLP